MNHGVTEEQQNLLKFFHQNVIVIKVWSVREWHLRKWRLSQFRPVCSSGLQHIVRSMGPESRDSFSTYLPLHSRCHIYSWCLMACLWNQGSPAWIFTHGLNSSCLSLFRKSSQMSADGGRKWCLCPRIHESIRELLPWIFVSVTGSGGSPSFGGIA